MVGPYPVRARTTPAFSLIFPTYNAAGFLDATWQAVEKFLRAGSGEWEVLFVCDGCTDDTSARLTERIAQGPDHVRLISYPVNRGKGHAIRRGMEAARGQWRIFTDVDLAYRFEDILRIADTLRAGADVAIASRLHPDSRVVVPTRWQGYAYRRHFQSLIFSTLVRRLLPLSQRDTQAGLKGLSARAVRLLWPLWQCDGFGFDCELLVSCRSLGIPVAEVPVTMHYDGQASTTGWRSLPRILRDIWAVRQRWARTKVVPIVFPAEDWAERPAA
jgi:glycosyltransferase involved in cell wall biosynthesis